MSDEKPRRPDRSRRMYVLWALALTLLGAAGLFSWHFAGPLLQARKVVSEVAGGKLKPREAVEEFGGPRETAVRVYLFLRLPEWALPEGGAGRKMRLAAVGVLAAGAERDKSLPAGRSEPLAVLRKLLRTDRDALIRLLSFRALAALSRAEAADVERALSDADGKVRLAAAQVADRLNLFVALVRAAADASLQVRGAAGFGLARRRDHRAVPLLIEVMAGGDYWEQRRAERELEAWFHARIRGRGPGQRSGDGAVATAWGNWWRMNQDHIARYRTLPVRKGDTLLGIAAMVYAAGPRGWSPGEKWKAIQAANGGIDPRRLPVGMDLVIPVLAAREEKR